MTHIRTDYCTLVKTIIVFKYKRCGIETKPEWLRHFENAISETLIAEQQNITNLELQNIRWISEPWAEVIAANSLSNLKLIDV